MRKIFTAVLAVATVLAIYPLAAVAQDQPEQKKVEVKVTEKVIPYSVKYVFSRNLSAGRTKKVQDGHDGKIVWKIIDTVVDGVAIKTERTEERVEPVEAIIQMGTSGFKQSSRSSFTRDKVLTMESTAYLPTDGSGTGRTASGRKAAFGVVAVDPKVIPLGTLLFVEGYGFAIAADTGGAIKGNKIDVCLHNRKEALNWGRRKVKVHVFEGKHKDN